MTIKDFIEKAIEGGWKKKYYMPSHPDIFETDCLDYKHEILLDPKAWGAVGKVEGWLLQHKRGGTQRLNIRKKCTCGTTLPQWKHKQLDFIKALQQGKDIESALKEI